jgi:hypothetical protein
MDRKAIARVSLFRSPVTSALVFSRVIAAAVVRCVALQPPASGAPERAWRIYRRSTRSGAPASRGAAVA